MHDLLVIGGGFWGQAITLLAREKGVDCLLIDDGNQAGASRNAAGLINPDWYKQPTVKKMLPGWFSGKEFSAGLEWLAQFGLAKRVEYFTRWNSDDVKERSIFALPDTAPWVVPDKVCQVSSLIPGGNNWPWTARSVEGEYFSANKVVCATGVWTNDLMRQSSLPTIHLTGLLGRAVIMQLAEPSRDEIYTHLARPYCHLTSRPWGDGFVRIGDTVEPKRNDNKLALLMSDGCPLQVKPRPVKVLEGLRPVCPELCVEETQPGLLIATGGHRVGLGLAYPVAQEAMCRLRFT